MAKIYKTKSGDYWDMIAYEAYGNESYVSYLMSANQDKLGYVRFPAGVELIIPDLTEADKDLLPDWRA